MAHPSASLRPSWIKLMRSRAESAMGGLPGSAAGCDGRLPSWESNQLRVEDQLRVLDEVGIIQQDFHHTSGAESPACATLPKDDCSGKPGW